LRDENPRPCDTCRHERAKKVARDSAAKRNVPSRREAVDDYLTVVPEPARSTLERVRAAMRSVVPAEATEAITLLFLLILVPNLRKGVYARLNFTFNA